MKISLKNIGLATIIIAGLSTSSCKKETVTPLAPAPTNEQFETSRNSYFDAQNFINEAISRGQLSFKNESETTLNGCTTVTLDTTVNPHTVLIDFGPGCTGYDGKVRGGQIYATFNNRDMSLAGTTVHAEFRDYTVDGDTIGGTLDLVNNGATNDATMEGTIDVNSNISFEGNAGTLEGNFHYDLHFYNNYTPINQTDDLFAFWGGGTGIVSSGREFTLTLTEPLYRKRQSGCNFFVGGIVTLDIDGESTRTMDYGNGTCDNIATIIQDGNTQTITLH